MKNNFWNKSFNSKCGIVYVFESLNTWLNQETAIFWYMLSSVSIRYKFYEFWETPVHQWEKNKEGKWQGLPGILMMMLSANLWDRHVWELYFVAGYCACITEHLQSWLPSHQGYSLVSQFKNAVLCSWVSWRVSGPLFHTPRVDVL